MKYIDQLEEEIKRLENEKWNCPSFGSMFNNYRRKVIQLEKEIEILKKADGRTYDRLIGQRKNHPEKGN